MCKKLKFKVNVVTFAERLVRSFAAAVAGRVRHSESPEILEARLYRFVAQVADGSNFRSWYIGISDHGVGAPHTEAYETDPDRVDGSFLQSKHAFLACRPLRNGQTDHTTALPGGKSFGIGHRQKAKQDTIRVGVINGIHDNFPELNTDWVLTGEGNMLLDLNKTYLEPVTQEEAQDSEEDIVSAIKAENTALKGEIKKLNSRLVDKDDVIQNLVAILKNKM